MQTPPSSFSHSGDDDGSEDGVGILGQLLVEESDDDDDGGGGDDDGNSDARSNFITFADVAGSDDDDSVNPWQEIADSPWALADQTGSPAAELINHDAIPDLSEAMATNTQSGITAPIPQPEPYPLAALESRLAALYLQPVQADAYPREATNLADAVAHGLCTVADSELYTHRRDSLPRVRLGIHSELARQYETDVANARVSGGAMQYSVPPPTWIICIPDDFGGVLDSGESARERLTRLLLCLLGMTEARFDAVADVIGASPGGICPPLGYWASCPPVLHPILIAWMHSTRPVAVYRHVSPTQSPEEFKQSLQTSFPESPYAGGSEARPLYGVHAAYFGPPMQLPALSRSQEGDVDDGEAAPWVARALDLSAFTSLHDLPLFPSHPPYVQQWLLFDPLADAIEDASSRAGPRGSAGGNPACFADRLGLDTAQTASILADAIGMAERALSTLGKLSPWLRRVDSAKAHGRMRAPSFGTADAPAARSSAFTTSRGLYSAAVSRIRASAIPATRITLGHAAVGAAVLRVWDALAEIDADARARPIRHQQFEVYFPALAATARQDTEGMLRFSRRLLRAGARELEGAMFLDTRRPLGDARALAGHRSDDSELDLI